MALVLAGGVLGACLQDPAPITTTITYYVDGDAAYSVIVDGAGATDPDYVPYKAGYEFAGWYTDEACTIPFDFQTYAANENRTDISVYAKFDIISATITYMSEGSVFNTYTVEGFTGTDPEYAPTKDGYAFAGWYRDVAFTTPFDYYAYIANQCGTDITVYAKFDIISTTITYMSEGSVYGTYTAEGITDTDPQYAPTKAGYTFAGWYTDEACTTPFDFAAYMANENRTDITVYAKFRTLYNITYVVNGADSEIESTQATSGTTVVLPTPERENYIFMGWYETQNPSSANEREESSIIMPGSDLIYYAMWADKPIDGYSFTIYDDGVTITGYTGSATQLDIPSYVLNKDVNAIGYGAFYGCSSLTSITIPNSVTSIGDDAFA